MVISCAFVGSTNRLRVVQQRVNTSPLVPANANQHSMHSTGEHQRVNIPAARRTCASRTCNDRMHAELLVGDASPERMQAQLQVMPLLCLGS